MSMDIIAKKKVKEQLEKKLGALRVVAGDECSRNVLIVAGSDWQEQFSAVQNRRHYDSDKPVILLTPGRERDVTDAVRVGVRVHARLDDPPSILLDAIEAATRGHPFWAPSLQEPLLDTARALLETSTSSADRRDCCPLTPRELEVARLVSQGFSNRKIARSLSVELVTVKFHVSNILRKLRVSSRDRVRRVLYGSGSEWPSHE